MLIFGLFMIVIGAIAASKFLGQKIPSISKVINKLEIAKGWLGVCAGFMGVFMVLISFDWVTSTGKLLLLSSGIINLIVGFMLGFALVQKYFLSENENAVQKGQNILNKLTPYNFIFGLISIALGAWLAFYSFVSIGTV